MDRLQPIDLATWPRRELFEHYRHQVPCTYAMTVEIDVTRMAAALATSPRKTYIAQVWALASLVNRHSEFRMGVSDAGEPATWDVLHPSFTVFNPERETFSAAWVPFDTDFGLFHDRAAEVLARHRNAIEMFPQGELPPNAFDVSSLPWTSFTGFTLQIKGGYDHLLPIFTLGRYVEREGRVLLPLAVQIHHAAADGFHTARLVEEFAAMAADPAWIS